MKLQDIEGYTEITQDSINSVKCTRILSGEGSERYNKYIQSLAKRVLLTSLNRLDGHKHDEVGILARLDGRQCSQLIMGCWNEQLATSVIPTTTNISYNNILDENMYTQTLVFVHNHPNNSGVSISDLSSLINNPEIRAIIAVGNNGHTKYAIKLRDDIEIYNSISNSIRKSKDSTKILYDIINNPSKYYIEFGG